MINTVFMATPEIAVKSLKELIQREDINVLAVVTQPDRPKNRGNKLTPPPVKVFAQECGIPVYQTEKIREDKELIAELKKLSPDFFVTFAFGQILSQEILDIPRYATVNIHASLLPKYRGANPIQRCIYNGDKKTGITTMLTVLELDAGDICENCEIEIDENMTDAELKEIIAEKSPDLICSTLEGLYKKTLIPRKQGNEGVCIANKFVKSDGEIDWTKSASEIHNKVRAMTDFPTAFTYFKGKQVKIIQTRLCDTDDKGCIPGETVCLSKEGITVATGEGCICITKVKPESKGIMNASDYANGIRAEFKTKFGD